MPEVLITALGRQGDGIADGPIHVERALPGETVSGEIEDGRIIGAKIIVPSADRVAPLCRHFKTCGGCQMQHAANDYLARWKTTLVVEALDAVGLSATVRGIDVSPPHSRRRAKFTARRTKSGAMAGFRARRSHAIIDVVKCPLVTPALERGPDLARALAEIGASRKGALFVQCTSLPNGIDVMVDGGKPLDDGLTVALPQIVQDFGVVRLVWNGDLVAQTAQPLHSIGRAQVQLPPGAFLQATEHGEATLQSLVQESLAGATQIADLFSGCGTFALCLAEKAPVFAVEGDKPMVRACQEAANHAQLRHPVKAVQRNLFDDPLSAAELSKFDAVVLDPPRAGAAAQVAELAKSNVKRLAYVSCDPWSFAKDAKMLIAGGYALGWIHVVDQFRWSPHVELAASFFRVDKGNHKSALKG